MIRTETKTEISTKSKTGSMTEKKNETKNLMLLDVSLALLYRGLHFIGGAPESVSEAF